MIRKQASLLLLIFLSVFTSSAQQVVKLNVGTDEKSMTNAVVFVDNTWLRLKPAKYGAAIQGGQFNFQFPVERNIMTELVLGSIRLPLYVQPGDSISIQITGGGIPSVNISGNDAEENAFLQKFFTRFESMFEDSLNQSKMLSSSIDAFESELFKLKKEQESFIKETANYTSLEVDFRSFVENQILYHYWGSLLTYPIARANSSATILTVDPIPDVMLEGLQNVKVNNEAALIADSYRSFLKNYNIYFTSKANGFKKFTDYSISADKKVAKARDNFQGGVYAYWLSKFITEECGRLAPFMVKKMQTELKEVDLKGVYFPLVKEYCDALPAISNVQSSGGKASTEINQGKNQELDLVDVNGKSVQLSDFKGKVVYIDFWASWCGPCRMMMPYSKKLHEQLTDKEKKQIAFLYISIDANKEAWLKGIKDMDIQGNNVISPGNWQSQACRYFQINSIPRYMIMNKKGEIVDFNAKRPADNAVLDDLRKFNAQ